MSVPASATWCAATGQLAILGAGGDSGIGILVRSDAIRSGEYVIVDTSASRAPAAIVAFRLVRGPRLIALSSDSGSLALASTGTQPVEGKYTAWFREPGTAAPVSLAGAFRGVEPATDSTACRAVVPAAEPTDSVVF